MKILVAFSEAGEVAEAHVADFTKEFLDTNEELVAKVGEPVARAILATQVASHMFGIPSKAMYAMIQRAEALEGGYAAVHELRQRAAHVAVTFGATFIRMFGMLAMDTIAATPKA